MFKLFFFSTGKFILRKKTLKRLLLFKKNDKNVFFSAANLKFKTSKKLFFKKLFCRFKKVTYFVCDAVTVGQMPFRQMPFRQKVHGHVLSGLWKPKEFEGNTANAWSCLFADAITVCQMPFCQMPFCQMPFCQMPFCQMPFCQIPFCQMPFCQMPFCQMPFCQMPLCQMPEGQSTSGVHC